MDFSGIWIRPFAVSGDKLVLHRLSDGLETCPSYLQKGLQLDGTCLNSPLPFFRAREVLQGGNA